jgi:hypothetical protein
MGFFAIEGSHLLDSERIAPGFYSLAGLRADVYLSSGETRETLLREPSVKERE